MTRKGQVTIPKHVREALGLQPFDKVEVEVVDGEARLRKAYPSLRELAGSVPGIGIPDEEAIAIAREERGEYLAEKMKRW
jgi:AbrB family looped-hinge helix DNA binding protein